MTKNMKIALLSWPFFANFCEKTSMKVVYICQEIKKITNATSSSHFLFWGGGGEGHFDKIVGGGGGILTKIHIFYQKVIK